MIVGNVSRETGIVNGLFCGKTYISFKGAAYRKERKEDAEIAKRVGVLSIVSKKSEW